ncbi:hypothetical protein HYU22_02800 [Candidatus Woesearchaeota archaeon]|nr:hypothetical protein [Candidatus Woesearchaeota archaeon]
MGLFSKIFHLFESNTPHHQLLDSYAQIHSLAKQLRRELRLLRRLQKQLILQKKSALGEKTGQLGLQKTIFVEEELLGKLRVLGKKAEERFSTAYETIGQSQPTSKLEQEEVERVIKYLKKVQSLISPFSSFSSLSAADKLLVVETELREVTKLSQEFYKTERYEQELARSVLEHEISPLLRKLYLAPEKKIFPGSGAESLLTFTLSPRQLRQLEQEAQKVNRCQDPRYRISWQRWWRDIQQPEKDKATMLHDPHINVTVKLFGSKKKDVHLLLRD